MSNPIKNDGGLGDRPKVILKAIRVKSSQDGSDLGSANEAIIELEFEGNPGNIEGNEITIDFSLIIGTNKTFTIDASITPMADVINIRLYRLPHENFTFPKRNELTNLLVTFEYGGSSDSYPLTPVNYELMAM